MTNVRKIALIYDWADTNYGGAEKVLLNLLEIYPQATLITAFADWKHAHWLKKFSKVRTTFLQKVPLLWRFKSFLALLMPMAFDSLDLNGFDIVISVSSFAAKGVLTKPGQLHLCYLLTPTRFLYSHTNSYLNPFWTFFTRPIRQYLEKWDKIAAWRPDYIIAISQLVADRCAQYYTRRVDGILYPTIIDLDQNQHDLKQKDAFLYVGRLVGYKNVDKVIKICLQKQQKLRIIGSGPELKHLQKLTKKDKNQNLIEFLGNVSQKELSLYYNKAIALLAPGLEDFGINLLEANQQQTWVIAPKLSGACELLDENMLITLDESQTNFGSCLDQANNQVTNCLLAKRQSCDRNEFQLQFSKLVKDFYEQSKT